MNQEPIVSNEEKMKRALQTIMVEMYDSTSATFGMPKCFQNEETAKRWFADMCINDDFISKHPSDFSLYHCGYWNSITGDVEAVEKTLIVNGDQIPKGENNGKVTSPALTS